MFLLFPTTINNTWGGNESLPCVDFATGHSAVLKKQGRDGKQQRNESLVPPKFEHCLTAET